MATRILKPQVVFEIGTNFGFTAAHFALNSPPTARIYTLDLPRDSRVRTKLPTTAFDDIYIREWRSVGLKTRQHEAFERIEYLTGDSATFDFSPYEGKIDIFFVDGSHSYEYVSHDTQSALRCCRPGGVIIWDDYGRYGLDGVTRHIDELGRQIPIYRIANTALAIHIVKS